MFFFFFLYFALGVNCFRDFGILNHRPPSDLHLYLPVAVHHMIFTFVCCPLSSISHYSSFSFFLFFFIFVLEIIIFSLYIYLPLLNGRYFYLKKYRISRCRIRDVGRCLRSPNDSFCVSGDRLPAHYAWQCVGRSFFNAFSYIFLLFCKSKDPHFLVVNFGW